MKSSSSAKTFNVDITDLIGNVAAIGIVTRESGEIIGNSLKTIYSRLTTMKPSIDALSEIGINVHDSEGDIKSATVVLDELSEKWNHLSDEQRQNLGKFNAPYNGDIICVSLICWKPLKLIVPKCNNLLDTAMGNQQAIKYLLAPETTTG